MGAWGQVILHLLILCKTQAEYLTPGLWTLEAPLGPSSLPLGSLWGLITSWGLGGKNEGVMEAACLGECSTPKQGSSHQDWSAALVSCVTQSGQVTGAQRHCKQG